MSENKRSAEREEQRHRSVGEANPNLGSNRNAEGTRQVTNRERVQHQVVGAHGAADIGHTPDQQTRKHEQGVFESKGESGKREAKQSGVTLGRHISSKSGAEVSADRAQEVKFTRARREAENFGK